jgi:hypothetical protein
MDIGETEGVWEVEPITEPVETPETQPSLNEIEPVSTSATNGEEREKKGTWK